MVAPALAGTFFFWNLSFPVGPDKPNMLDDVELVRYGYNCMRHAQTNLLMPYAPEFLNLISRMRVYGSFGEDLHEVILAHQKLTARPKDGCVMPGQSLSPTLPQDDQIIIALNVMMRAHEAEFYPRIDRSIASGAEVSKVCVKYMG